MFSEVPSPVKSSVEILQTSQGAVLSFVDFSHLGGSDSSFRFRKDVACSWDNAAPWPIRIKAKTWHDNGCSVSSRSMRKAIYYVMYHPSSLYVVHICNICTYIIYTHIGFRVYYTYGSYTQCNPTYVNQQTKRRRAADKKKEWHQHDQLTVSPVSLLSLLTLGHQP